MVRHLSDRGDEVPSCRRCARPGPCLSWGQRTRRALVGATTADVLVIGAGAIGASCAYQLARAGLRTVVADQFGGPAEGNTGRCFASVRAQWADDLNIVMSLRGIEAFRSFPDEHGLDVGYAATGYLFAVPPGDWPARLAAVERQRSHGVPVEVLDP